MTKEADAGTGADETRAWDARLGWAFGLIADDPAERAAALAQLADAQGKVEDALGRYNDLWHLTLPPGGQEQWRDSVLLRAYERYVEAGTSSLPEALWNRPAGDIRTWPGLPYALLFLEWEARYPQEWTRHAKHWGTKQSLVRAVAVAGHGERVRAKLTDLVELVVRRAYRCKDREYLRVARAVDGADLRGRLDTAARSDDPWARRHAGYVLWLLDRPEVPNSLHVWQTWLSAEADG
ncbi:hypothetical protein GCM10018790_55980 [Kitasatospora xanthocidica]|uniref:hypothetical protein n=1 Tax=Kitasatospora xanthocidica TaxID=83382 RepID=UPI0019C60511|nr:hypothetical protein [Kitasatospora xanthocidica]GHF70943.1 hypothetical protein GCM10018790_55980 [Kitasatospora xanthocidica]